MIWRMKFECEASSCFLGEGVDMALTGNRAILPQRPAIACEWRDQPVLAEVNARARQIATAAENAAGAMKKYTPQRIVNPR